MAKKLFPIVCILLVVAALILAALVRESIMISSDVSRAVHGENNLSEAANENCPQDLSSVVQIEPKGASMTTQQSISTSERNFNAENPRITGFNPQEAPNNQIYNHHLVQTEKGGSPQVYQATAAFTQNVSKYNNISQAVPSRSLTSLAVASTATASATAANANANANSGTGSGDTSTPPVSTATQQSQAAEANASGGNELTQDSVPPARHQTPFDTPILYQIDQNKLAQIDPAAASDIIYIESQYTDYYNKWAQQTPNNVRAWNMMVNDINVMVAQRVAGQTLSQLMKP